MSAPFPMPATADLARALHARRELRDALEYGFALLDALGLPPLALDVIDDGIAALDRMDAAEEDLEDEPDCDHTEAYGEADNGDDEPSLGAFERHEDFVTRIGGRWCVIAADQQRWAVGGSDDREQDIVDEPHDGEDDAEPSIGWPEDFTAKLDDVLQADHDPELDDADLEDGADSEQTYEDPFWSRHEPMMVGGRAHV